MDFRVADAADAGELVDLVHSAYRGAPSRVGWTTEADLLDGKRIDFDGVERAIKRDGSIVLLGLDEDGAILACCHLERRGHDLASFGMFAVRPARQGGGTGRLMLAEAESVARREWGAGALEMTVIGQRDELIAWYERRGYERTGETRPFPYGDHRFGIPRRDDLHFVVLRKDFAPAVSSSRATGTRT